MSTLVEILNQASPAGAQRLGWVLVHFLWQGAAIAALLWLALRLLARRRPHARYMVACLALVLMVAAPVVTFFLAQPGSWLVASGRAGQSSDPSLGECYILGEVDRPGVYVAGKTIADALKLAGARRSHDAAWKGFLIRRTPGQREHVLDLDLSAIESGSVDAPSLQTGDQLVVGYEASERSVILSSAFPRRRLENQEPFPWGAATKDQQAESSIARIAEPALPYAVAIWLAGVIVCSVWHVGGWLKVRRLRRGGQPLDTLGDETPATAAWLDAAERLAAAIGLHRPVRLLKLAGGAACGLAGPVVFGVLRPAVLIPAAVLTGLTPPHIEAILAHELAHIRRHDYLVNLLQTIVETLLFYHPAVWWVSARIRTEREHCCDDLAVAAISLPAVASAKAGSMGNGHRAPGERSRRTYAEALATLAKIAAASQPAPRAGFARLAPGAGMSLLSRIRRLLGVPSGPSSRWTTALAGLIVLTALFAGVAFYGCTADSTPQAPESQPPPRADYPA